MKYLLWVYLKNEGWDYYEYDTEQEIISVLKAGITQGRSFKVTKEIEIKLVSE